MNPPLLIIALFIIPIIYLITKSKKDSIELEGFLKVKSYCAYIEEKFGIKTEIYNQDKDLLVVLDSEREGRLLNRLLREFEIDYSKQHENEVKFITQKDYV